MADFSSSGNDIPLDGLTAAAPAVVNITTTSREIIAADDGIVVISVDNIGNQDVNFGFGQPAEAGKGLVLRKGEGRIFPFPGGIKEAVNAITSMGTTDLTIQVWT